MDKLCRDIYEYMKRASEYRSKGLCGEVIWWNDNYWEFSNGLEALEKKLKKRGYPDYVEVYPILGG